MTHTAVIMIFSLKKTPMIPAGTRTETEKCQGIQHTRVVFALCRDVTRSTVHCGDVTIPIVIHKDCLGSLKQRFESEFVSEREREREREKEREREREREKEKERERERHCSLQRDFEDHHKHTCTHKFPYTHVLPLHNVSAHDCLFPSPLRRVVRVLHSHYSHSTCAPLSLSLCSEL